MSRRFAIATHLVGALLWLMPPVFAAPGAGAGREPVRRTVLALYDGGRFPGTRETTVHKLAEMPLNHLGLIVRYHDLRTGVPGPDALRDVRGVLTWFESEVIPNPRAYLRWVEALARSGTPLVSQRRICAARYSAVCRAYRRLRARMTICDASSWSSMIFESPCASDVGSSAS